MKYTDPLLLLLVPFLLFFLFSATLLLLVLLLWLRLVLHGRVLLRLWFVLHSRVLLLWLRFVLHGRAAAVVAVARAAQQGAAVEAVVRAVQQAAAVVAEARAARQGAAVVAVARAAQQGAAFQGEPLEPALVCVLRGGMEQRGRLGILSATHRPGHDGVAQKIPDYNADPAGVRANKDTAVENSPSIEAVPDTTPSISEHTRFRV